jgi:hypothetical protein
VWRANIILATADGCGTTAITRRSGKAKPVVWTWQARFMAEGVEGLLRDKTRRPGKPPLPPETVQRVVGLALGPPPGDVTHWTGRTLAKAAGVSLRSVQRILEAHQLAPHRIRTFKLSKDPEFAEKLRDIVGLYVDPPAHAVILSSVDEKSQIQATGARTKGDPRCRRQLCHPQTSQGAKMAGPASALDIPLHTHLGVLAQRCRGLFSKLTRRRLKRGVSARSPTCRPPSTSSLQRQTPIPNPSSGPPTHKAFSPLSNGGR